MISEHTVDNHEKALLKNSYDNMKYNEEKIEITLKLNLLNERVAKSRNLKIACVVVPNYGHMFPISHLGDLLKQRGHDVYVITIGNKEGRKRAPNVCGQYGLKIIYTDGPEQTEMYRKPANWRDATDESYLRLWEPHCIKAVHELNPDIVVCDFFSRNGILAADEMGIPSVINVPGSLTMLDEYGMLVVPNMKNACNCCGMICIRQTCTQLCAGFVSQIYLEEERHKAYYKSWSSRVMLFNSFWGLEKAITVPPNLYHTGPLSPPQHDLLTRFKEKDEALFNWFEQALKNKQDVVIITLGSECIYQPWYITTIYDGLKKLGCKVLWSLRGDFKLPEENKNFWISPWIPQIEALSHPAVKAGLTHCGFGGTLEFIAAGVPMVTFPHMIDQPENSKYLAEVGVAIELFRKQRWSNDFSVLMTWPEPMFTSDTIYESFKEIITNDKYRKNMLKLQLQCRSSGGRNMAANVIERTYLAGCEHLVDWSMVKKMKKMKDRKSVV